MSNRWHRRMLRLERRMPIPVPPCPGCNYPDVHLRGVVVTEGDEPVPQCLQCARYVAHDGAPLTEPIKHIILPLLGSEELREITP